MFWKKYLWIFAWNKFSLCLYNNVLYMLIVMSNRRCGILFVSITFVLSLVWANNLGSVFFQLPLIFYFSIVSKQQNECYVILIKCLLHYTIAVLSNFAFLRLVFSWFKWNHEKTTPFFKCFAQVWLQLLPLILLKCSEFFCSFISDECFERYYKISIIFSRWKLKFILEVDTFVTG